MTVQDFRNLLAARPFEPFRVVMSSGERYEVRHPEMAYLMRTKILIGLDPDRHGTSDDWRMISLLHITFVEPIRSKSSKRKSA
jgi:hypothetical protein